MTKMTLTACERRAQNDNASDKATFDLVGPLGRMHCRWLDAYFGMFVEIGNEKGAFISRDFDLPELFVENYNPGPAVVA